MNAQSIFNGLRSLRTVADDVLDALTDNVDEALDKFEDFVDRWEKNYDEAVAEKAPQEPQPEAAPEPTRFEKNLAIYSHLVRKGGPFSETWNPYHPDNSEIADSTIDWAYDRWVLGKWNFDS